MKKDWLLPSPKPQKPHNFMANDPSMPPSEQNPGTPVNNSPAMSSPDMSAPAAPAGGDGSIMISMPKPAFDAIHTLVTQLAQGLDQLKQGVEQQAQGGAPTEAPAALAQAPAAPADAKQENDEDFLKGLAEEGNKR